MFLSDTKAYSNLIGALEKADSSTPDFLLSVKSVSSISEAQSIIEAWSDVESIFLMGHGMTGGGADVQVSYYSRLFKHPLLLLTSYLSVGVC
jgi:hypothetical protein